MNDERLQHFLDRLVDHEAVDWDAAERELPQRSLRALRRLDSIANAYRRVAPAAEVRRFGRLVLIERIGGGLGGEVWRARDPLVERLVALKLDDGGADSGRQARLLEEARTLARIDHPNVLRVLGADVVAGRVGIWSEFVDGEDLAARLQRDGRSGAGEAQAIGTALCGALAAIHAAGFVHGDVKPHNVLRTRDGRHVLCDLGSAVALHDRVGTRALASGSPLYLAPEVLAGAAPGVASDVYALGATLFHLLGGRAPVEGDDIQSLLAAHRDGRRSHLRDLRPDLPGDLVAAIERALSTRPSARPGSAGAFEALLAPRARTRIATSAFAACAVAAIAAAVWSVTRDATPTTLARDVRWQRGDASVLHDGAAVRAGDTVRVEFACTRRCWALVLAEDGTHEIAILHPPRMAQARAYAANTPLRLPGIVDGAERDWRVGPARGNDEHLLLLVSAHELPPDAITATGTGADGERFRGIDGLVASAPPAGGLAAVAAALRGNGDGIEAYPLQLRRADAPSPRAAD